MRFLLTHYLLSCSDTGGYVEYFSKNWHKTGTKRVKNHFVRYPGNLVIPLLRGKNGSGSWIRTSDQVVNRAADSTILNLEASYITTYYICKIYLRCLGLSRRNGHKKATIFLSEKLTFSEGKSELYHLLLIFHRGRYISYLRNIFFCLKKRKRSGNEKIFFERDFVISPEKTEILTPLM